MGSVAVGIMCKTPEPGKSKTRLSPPLRPEECAGLSACFIRDLSQTIAGLAEGPEIFGLIHGDLQVTNFLFSAGRVAAIDFADSVDAIPRTPATTVPNRTALPNANSAPI